MLLQLLPSSPVTVPCLPQAGSGAFRVRLSWRSENNAEKKPSGPLAEGVIYTDLEAFLEREVRLKAILEFYLKGGAQEKNT